MEAVDISRFTCYIRLIPCKKYWHHSLVLESMGILPDVMVISAHILTVNTASGAKMMPRSAPKPVISLCNKTNSKELQKVYKIKHSYIHTFIFHLVYTAARRSDLPKMSAQPLPAVGLRSVMNIYEKQQWGKLMLSCLVCELTLHPQVGNLSSCRLGCEILHHLAECVIMTALRCLVYSVHTIICVNLRTRCL